jgi:glycosyltransferase involved in cell wall biosynthesis
MILRHGQGPQRRENSMEGGMKILYVIAGVPPLSGGPTTALFGMVRALRALGIEVEVATTDADISGNLPVPIGRKIVEQNVPIYYFRCPTLRKYGCSPALTRWLRAHIREYNLVHIHDVFAHPTLPAAASARKAAVPYIIRPCGQLDPWSLRKNSFLKRTFLALAGQRILQHAAAIHATSEPEKASIEQLGINVPVVTIPLGIEALPESDSSLKGLFRERHPELGDRKVILFLSRIDPKKGLDLLLTALQKIEEKRDDFVLVLVGSGAPSFEGQVRSSVIDLGLDGLVIFAGFLDGQMKQAALYDADLFVLPSYDENFGIAVVEAMAMGLPVLISDQVGIHRDVQEYEAGLVTRCNAGEIAEALSTLLDDESLRHRMGENGRRLVQEKFTWSQVGHELLKLYRSILASKIQTRS